MKALVLAAGRSTRLDGLGGGRPKPLLEVGGRSLLEWNLRWLAGAGMGPIWVNLHHRGEEVRAAVEAMEVDAEVRFSPEDPILGTAGAWRNLADEWDDTSLVVYGDNLTRFDLAAFVAAHGGRVAEGALATVALMDVTRHVNTGIAGSRVVVEGHRVVEFLETRGGAAGGDGAPVLVSTGACLLEPAVAARVEPGFRDFGGDVFPALVAAAELSAHVLEPGGFCLGLDTPEHFQVGRDHVEAGRVAL